MGALHGSGHALDCASKRKRYPPVYPSLFALTGTILGFSFSTGPLTAPRRAVSFVATLALLTGRSSQRCKRSTEMLAAIHSEYRADAVLAASTVYRPR
jgi:hypothetical protein